MFLRSSKTKSATTPVKRRSSFVMVLSAALFSFLILLSFSNTAKADRIILRNLKILNGVTVTAFDEDGVKIAGQGIVTWDEIERGTVAADKQAGFDRLKLELGTPLYRIRQRLTVGDYSGLVEEAEKLLPRYRSRSSQSAYMVVQALMWGRLADNRREEAVEAYLLCFDQLRNNKSYYEKLPGPRKLNYDATSGFTSEIVPVFFDKEAAKKILPKIRTTAQSMKAPIPQAALIYYVTIALAAEDVAAADNLLANVKDTPAITGQWKTLCEAQKHVLAKEYELAEIILAGQVYSMHQFNRPAAHYWLGTARILGSDPNKVERGALDLLIIPATQGDKSSELSAAALHRAMQAYQRLKQPGNLASVRKELLSKFSGTFHATQLKKQLSNSNDL
ncbi:MAG: hypothetical protein COA78_10165 [Blastopirellula sp.]|nr:MAG: hypothetical protein COA78_10165 [Blastopirellula sp.]